MPDAVQPRPFGEFRFPLTDPWYFVGRKDLVTGLVNGSSEVRILLGGRRSGKSSTLQAVKRSLEKPDGSHTRRMFPVYMDLQLVNPESLDGLRALMARWLRDVVVDKRSERSRVFRLGRRVAAGVGWLISGVLKAVQFTAQGVGITVTMAEWGTPVAAATHTAFCDALRRGIRAVKNLGFDGVCFLFDETEVIVRQDWSDDAWGYFRGLKADTKVGPSFGLILSGYRRVGEYRQRVGSPLRNLARVDWLDAVDDFDVRRLIRQRENAEGVRLSDVEKTGVVDLAGGHPYVAQQVISVMFDARRQGVMENTESESVCREVADTEGDVFRGWWNADGESDGFQDEERRVYRTLVRKRRATVAEVLETGNMRQTEVAGALEVLVGTGVVRRKGDMYSIGTRVFEEWMVREAQ